MTGAFLFYVFFIYIEGKNAYQSRNLDKQKERIKKAYENIMGVYMNPLIDFPADKMLKVSNMILACEILFKTFICLITYQMTRLPIVVGICSMIALAIDIKAFIQIGSISKKVLSNKVMNPIEVLTKYTLMNLSHDYRFIANYIYIWIGTNGILEILFKWGVFK